MQAKTIDEVISFLTEIIDQAKNEENAVGYFPALYRLVTQKIKEGIAEGYFEDGPRMEKLDVVFANRYLAAYAAYRDGRPLSECWRVSFDACQNRHLLVLQHLMMGMNAHINLDLGIAAAEVCPQAEIEGLKDDFFKINGVLASLVGLVQDELAKIHPFMARLDRVAGRVDEKFADFSMSIARGQAWKLSEEFAYLPSQDWQDTLHAKDDKVLRLGQLMENPGFGLRLALRFVRRKELRPVSAAITVLEGHQPTLAEVKQRVAALPPPVMA